jgi:hypothetical protein
MLPDQGDWTGVPDQHQAEWQHIFQESQESLDLSGSCPVCGEVALHRWYQIGEPIHRVIEGRKYVAKGGLWEWCSGCHCFEHYSALVPDWWSCDLEVETAKLAALPIAIEDARKSQSSG